MKQLLVLILLISFSISTFSQEKKKELPESKEWFLQKSKQQKKVAWWLLGGGSLMVVSGYTLFVAESLLGDGVKSFEAKLGIGVFVVGAASVITSVPLFIEAARNKGIAQSGYAGLKFESLDYVNHPSITKRSYPALSFKINLR